MILKAFRHLSLAVVPIALLTGVPAIAHHSFAAEYDRDQPVTLKGTLTKVEWTNPHGWIYIDVKGETGKVTNWAVEFGAPNALLRRGLRRTDFPSGVELLVKGYRAKSGSPAINGTAVQFPDGRNLFTGSSNPDAPGAEKTGAEK
ncbi:MAG: DUF6152 family protein [Acidobacteriota bacterium]|nr:DUF6152 family protein [Acidobacteriota bacterium]